MLAKGLIEKMQGLETYPPQFGAGLNGPNTEYEHAKTFLATKGIKEDRHKKCGTLSESEWEATCKTINIYSNSF